MDDAALSPFGARLRRWRTYRGVSQMSLAGQIGSTARHLSFLETGRSRPSRQMVLRLGEALAVSLRERNALLHAAGLPSAYPEIGMHNADLAPFRAAIDTCCARICRIRRWSSTATGACYWPTPPAPGSTARTWSAATSYADS